MREPCTRTDILFAKKNGGEIFQHLHSSLEKKNNAINNMNAVYTTIALFCVELFCEETLFDFIRLVLSFQELAVTSTILSPTQKIHLHVISLSLISLIAQFLPVLKNYVNSVSARIELSACLTQTPFSRPLAPLSYQITNARREHAIHLLHPLKVKYEVYEPSQNIHDACKLNYASIADVLKEDGIEETNKGSYYLFPRHSWVDAQAGSATDINSISVDIDSGASTPEIGRASCRERV